MNTLSDRHRALCCIPFALVAVVAMLFLLNHQSTRVALADTQAEPLPFTAEYYAGVNERFGVGLGKGIAITDALTGLRRSARITDYDVEALHIGWYSDWDTNVAPLRPGGIHYAQVIAVRPTEYPSNTLQLTATIAANPGSLWIVGNEPEAKYNQGKRTPDEYASIYHDMYTLIKGLDPSAQVAIGGVVEPTPLRLKWLELVLAEYESLYGQTMPVDVWNIHVQILQEVAGTPTDPEPWGAEVPVGLEDMVGMLYTPQDNADPQIFQQLVIGFRQWMKTRGFQDKPLIISEYGVLMPSDILADGNVAAGDQMVVHFMHTTFDFLVNARDTDLGYPEDNGRLVQQWLWYSLNDRPFDGVRLGFNGSLFDYLNPEKMTQFGYAFRYYMHILLDLPRVMLPTVGRRFVAP
ncbi:MAG: hypothetical protein FJ026_04405 [Chloroflexi bacterium]|nr:hypothetical protein [Chloroflexota bacterium]